MLHAVSRAASGVLRAVKPQNFQNEASKVVGALTGTRKFLFFLHIFIVDAAGTP